MMDRISEAVHDRTWPQWVQQAVIVELLLVLQACGEILQDYNRDH